MNRKLYNELKAKVESLERQINGGKGSGNFGHAGRPGEIGGSASIGGKTQTETKTGRLEGPATTKEEYALRDASKECQEKASELFSEWCDHAERIAEEGSFAKGFSAEDYLELADELGYKSDNINSKEYRPTQQSLVETVKKTKEKLEEYGMIDGSSSNILMDEFLSKYEYKEGKDKEKEIIDRAYKAQARDWARDNSFGERVINGGKGSGNFGHAGRPGEVGGSAPEGVSYSIPSSILDAYQTSSSRYNDPSKMTIETTPKGNLHLMYDGKDVSTIDGNRYSEETLEDLREQGVLQDSSRGGEDTTFHSRYEDKKSFEYDGETFYVDDDKRGGTTKDGRRTMMFPDEILFARSQIIDRAMQADADITESKYRDLIQLHTKLGMDERKLSDKRDVEYSKELRERLKKVILAYEDENPNVNLRKS